LAVSYFDRSFVGTSRLSVSLAFSQKTGPPSSIEYRPWSKHSAGSSRYAKLHQKDDEAGGGKEENNIKSKQHTEEDVDEGVNDRKKEEFLSAMGISTRVLNAVHINVFETVRGRHSVLPCW